MMAVILSGGKGTRLRPFTISIPKPLLPLGDRPILEIILQQLSGAGVRRVVITLGHMAPLFTAMVGEGAKYGLDIDFCHEDEPLGTAAPLRLIKDLEDDFIVMNGDILTTLDYGALFDQHRKSGATGTIAVHKRTVNIDYGVIETDGKGYLENYIEKPSLPYFVSMGINVLSKRCLDFIPPSGKFDMPELMMAIHKDGRKVACFETDCYWQDIGRFDDYQQASEDFTKDSGSFFMRQKPA